MIKRKQRRQTEFIIKIKIESKQVVAEMEGKGEVLGVCV